jgi:hypothetical protein
MTGRQKQAAVPDHTSCERNNFVRTPILHALAKKVKYLSRNLAPWER